MLRIGQVVRVEFVLNHYNLGIVVESGQIGDAKILGVDGYIKGYVWNYPYLDLKVSWVQRVVAYLRGIPLLRFVKGGTKECSRICDRCMK